jgi:galactokinase
MTRPDHGRFGRVREIGGYVSVTWRAPGRVNLIGEHTDYNAGFALPFAIAQGCTAIVSPASDPVLTIASAQQADRVQLPLDRLRPGAGGWAGYVAGVAAALQRRGAIVPGLRIEVDSDVPVGAGLSSSAALTCAVTTALDDLLGLELSADELLAVARSAENDFVGAPTGGMDQLAALRCRDGQALLCDMGALQTEDVPLDPGRLGLTVLVIDSRAGHRHADGEYRQRRDGCERAARVLGVAALREISTGGLDEALAALPDDELRRYTRHIVTENARVLDTVALLRADRLADIGPLLTDSHRSMRDDYRITIPELDVAVLALLDSGALGARMTGGGFGGSVIALIEAGRVAAAVRTVRTAYERHHFAPFGWFTTRPAQGAHRLIE